MPILLGILAGVGAIIIFIIRTNAAAQAARELGEAAAEAKGFLRRKRWKSQTNTDQIRNIEDPRLSAAVMMCALAKSDDDLSAREVSTIVDLLRENLELSPAEADEMLAQARRMTRDMGDLGTILRRATPPIQAGCTPEQKSELLEMLTTVATADGPIDAIQQDAMDRLRRDFDPDRR
ncbi:MAG: hypothetical protein HKN28_01315 [Alphaproteobacteria bacterium]|nr:hypothetical protein [Alphaproteobacteria bacterium]